MTEFEWIAVAVVTVISASRLTRLATFDEFPPARWLRDKYADATDGSSWQLLAYCPWCASFWVTAFVVTWAGCAGVLGAGVFDGRTAWDTTGEIATPIWWLVNSTLAGSYLAAMLMVRDGEEADD